LFNPVFIYQTFQPTTNLVVTPPIVACYELQGLEAACMSGDAHIMVLFNDTVLKVFVIGDIDLTVKHE
jgi:hypothetical protein